MVAMKEKRALFGGALRCAGLAAATAVTSGAMADFNRIDGPGPAPNYTFNYAFDPAGGQLVFAYDLNYAGGFPATTSYAGIGGTLSAYANAALMGASLTVGDPAVWDNAGAVVVQYFTVSDGKEGLLEWDLTTGNAYAYTLVYQFGVGNLAYEVAGSSGSSLLAFVAGETYAFIARVAINAPTNNGDTVFASLTWVPAPGALPLLGLGMLGTKRRRRRE